MTRLTAHTVRASFPAHGSSVAGPCHGYLVRSWADRAVHGRFRIVAVSMQELTVAGRGRTAAAAREPVVAFHQVPKLGEVPSAPGTAPLLPLEQGRLARGQFGVAAQSAGPVGPVAIIRAGVPSDQDVAPDRRPGMGSQVRSVRGTKAPVVRPAGVPVAA